MSPQPLPTGPLTPQDPRLTAYVLGELSERERAAVEDWLASSAEGRAEVAALQELTAALFAALRPDESAKRLPTLPVESLIAAALDGPSVGPAGRPMLISRTSPPLRRNRTAVLATVLTGCLLAAVALGLGTWRTEPRDIAVLSGGTQHRWSIVRDVSGSLPETTRIWSMETVPETAAFDVQVPGEMNLASDFQALPPDQVTRLQAIQRQQGVPQTQLGWHAAPMSSGSIAPFGGQLPPIDEKTQRRPIPVAGTPVMIPSYSIANPSDAAGDPVRSEYDTNSLYSSAIDGLVLRDQLQELSESELRLNNANRYYQGPVLNKVPYVDSKRWGRRHFSFFTTRELADFGLNEAPAPDAGIPSPVRAKRGENDAYFAGHRFQFLDDWDTPAPAVGVEEKLFAKEEYRFRPESQRSERELLRRLSERVGHEEYAPLIENAFVPVAETPLSTFGLDVDTASYANVRRMLFEHRLPPPEAIRIEELVNSFAYSGNPPTGNHPLAVTVDGGRCPWQPDHHLVRVSVHAREISEEKRPPTSLVFLIDSSGSMSDANKLPLVQASLRLLVERMEEQDRIAIVTYADEARTVLDSTTADNRDRILEAIDSLSADGSTNGAGGLELAYQVATRHLIKAGANRILLCTDGDFNVGVSDNEGVFELIEDHRKTGVFLTVLGFGTGNLKDAKLEGVANRGNGHYVYVDRLEQARRTLVEQLTGTLFAVAKDVKIQVEFNPTRVEAYRLIGHENRRLNDRDFADDRVDAGEIGAGHRVTALYEIVPTGGKIGAQETPLRYQPAAVRDGDKVQAENSPQGTELLFVKLRYKQPDADESRLIETPLPADRAETLSQDGRWAAAAATFGLLLRDSKFKGQANWESLLREIRDGLTVRSDEDRVEFLDLALRAKSLHERTHGKPLESRTLIELNATEARTKASCGGRYGDLLDKFPVPEDGSIYGEFHEHGRRRGESYLGKPGRPDGYWVYVYPDWYVWGKRTDEAK